MKPNRRLLQRVRILYSATANIRTRPLRVSAAVDDAREGSGCSWAMSTVTKKAGRLYMRCRIGELVENHVIDAFTVRTVWRVSVVW